MSVHKSTCEHSGVYYAVGSDNYYCGKCHWGMGRAYYIAARERDRLLTDLAWLRDEAGLTIAVGADGKRTLHLANRIVECAGKTPAPTPSVVFAMPEEWRDA